ncbi:EthD domain-containing protein [Nocardia sp. NPDC059240]|uniref:EthD domain-containing protein n=1 Tax=Nocardia sp. NPDC059240 TaxID=3346786 RepID=UPI0036BDD3DF
MSAEQCVLESPTMKDQTLNENTHGSGPAGRTSIGGVAAIGLAGVLASQLPNANADTPSGGPIKLVGIVRRRADMTPARFDEHWLNVHAPVAVKALTVLGATRYVQSHTVDTVLNAATAFSHSSGQAFDGVIEVWFPSERELGQALATQAGAQANQVLADSENEFIDLAQSAYFLATESVIFG